jgi:hypothetical protein
MSIEFEKEVRLSKSLVWQMQKDYFASSGIDAWNHQVPFYVTSNPVVAKHYAKLVYSLMCDSDSDRKSKDNNCYYILELGTGSGQFSCYFLNFITDILKENNKEDLSFCYVMTDFTESNVKFWKEHPKLKEFVKKGVLDFAIYNLETQNDIELINKKIKLDKNTVKAPISVIANYIFDTVLNDAFSVRDGKLCESQVSLSTSYSNLDEQKNQPRKLEDIATEFTHKPISLNNNKYYIYDENSSRSENHRELMDRVVFSYTKEIKKGTFLFPLGALDCLSHLSEISDHGLMLLSTDKGVSHLFEIEGRGDPRFAFHKSFSVTVNFDSISRYVALKGGFSLFPEPRDGIKTAVCFMGIDKNIDLINVKEYFSNDLNRLTPADFFNYHRLLRESTPEVRSLKMMLSHFNMCLWDPYTFSLYQSEIIGNINKASRLVQEGFLSGMRKMAKLVYVMPGANDHYFNMAFLCHVLEDYEYAIYLYELSNKDSFGDSYACVYNLGLCYYALDDISKSVFYFEKAVLYTDEELKQTNKTASQWLKEINNR